MASNNVGMVPATRGYGPLSIVLRRSEESASVSTGLKAALHTHFIEQTKKLRPKPKPSSDVAY